MHSIWHYLETSPVWKQIAIAFAKRLTLVRSEKNLQVVGTSLS
jgi:hypothetical protein